MARKAKEPELCVEGAMLAGSHSIICSDRPLRVPKKLGLDEGTMPWDLKNQIPRQKLPI